MTSVTVRVAKKEDLASLLKMPQYSGVTFPAKDDILIAQGDGEVLGAVSVSQWRINCLLGEWKDEFRKERLNEVAVPVQGRWISKLYVFPEHRLQGVGTRLVEEAVSFLKDKGCDEVYAGIYIKTKHRETSHHIFEKRGFRKIGSCVCPLPDGYCRGILLKKSLLDESE